MWVVGDKSRPCLQGIGTVGLPGSLHAERSSALSEETSQELGGCLDPALVGIRKVPGLQGRRAAKRDPTLLLQSRSDVASMTPPQ